MDRSKRAMRSLDAASKHLAFRAGDRTLRSRLVSAEAQIKKLDETVIEEQSQLIKYRQNFTVPPVWVPQKGIRISNIPEIPPEKIRGLDTYIQANVNRIDGGNIEVN